MNTTPTASRRLVFPAAGRVELAAFTPAAPAPDEVLVEKICSLMSTGTENIVFGRKFDPGTHWDNWVKYPFYPGYASVGIVRTAGHEVTQLKVGDRVALRSGHSSHDVKKAAQCFLVPEGVPSGDAVWFGLAKISGHGVRAAKLALGDDVAVIGAGPIGQMAARWALMGGANRVVLVDLAEPRLQLAAAAGATPLLAPAAQATEAVIAALDGARPRVVIDSTGNAAVLHAAFELVETEGTVVILGDTGSPASQSLTSDVIRRGLTLVGAHDGRNSPGWNNEVAASRFFTAVQGGRFSLSGLNTHRFRPEDCADAYRTANEDRLRTMGIRFDWQPETAA